MSREACAVERFLKDVAEHQMKMLRDDGVHRHLQFRRPGTWSMGFEIVTFPGALVYSGDMGCYVFRRLEDMFEFFRRPDKSYRIDRRYWAEKCVAADRDGILEYSPEDFRKAAREWPAHSFDPVPPELLEEIEREVIPYANDGEHDARAAIEAFEWNGSDPAWRFRDFWEADLRDYTYRFTWCCYALAWTIEQYDTAKAAAHA